MQDPLVFLPVIVQILLTIILLAYLAFARARASKQGLVDEDRRSLHDDAWPDDVIQINNCVRNQFETPVLFYVLIVLLWLTEGVNALVHVFAWLYVISRLAHALVHVRSNYVPLRRGIFIAGGINLIALVVVLIFGVASAA